MIEIFFTAAHEKIKLKDGGYRLDQPRALAQRVEVGGTRVRIIGPKSGLLSGLRATTGKSPAAIGVLSSVPKWRRGRDSNPR